MSIRDTNDLLSIRANLVALQERGITHISLEDALQLVGERAEGLIDRAQAIQAEDHQSPQAEMPDAGDIVAAVGAAVQEKVDKLSSQLNDQHSSEYLQRPHDRAEAMGELRILDKLSTAIVSLKPGEALDLTRTETDQGQDYDEEHALYLQDRGVEYISKIDQQRDEHEHQLSQASVFLKQLHDAGVKIDTSFHVVQPSLSAADDVIGTVSAAVQGRFDSLRVRLYDRDSASYISEDSYATRYDTHAELGFLGKMAAGIASLKPGGMLDLSRTETDYGYDQEEAATDRMSGLEYVPAIERQESEHETHVYRVSGLLKQLQGAGVTVDTSFHAVPQSQDWDDEWRYEANGQELLDQIEANELRRDEHDINTAPVEGEQADSSRPQSL